MSSLRGVASAGKRLRSAPTISAVSSTDSVVCVTNARRVGIAHLQASRHRRRSRPDGCGRRRTHRSDPWCLPLPDGPACPIRMTSRAFARVALHFHVNLGDQRTRGIEHASGRAARPPPPPRSKRRAPRRSPWRPPAPRRSSSTNTAPRRAQPLDDVPVVHHFMPHVDRRAEELDRALDDVDGAIDAGAEAARISQQYLHRASLLRAPAFQQRIEQQQHRADGDGRSPRR